jgi:hypothetical protein
MSASDRDMSAVEKLALAFGWLRLQRWTRKSLAVLADLPHSILGILCTGAVASQKMMLNNVRQRSAICLDEPRKHSGV